MTTEQAQAVNAYVRHLQPLMGLTEWDVTLLSECPEGHDCADIAGCIKVSRYRRSASLYLPDAFWDDEPEEQRQTIVHELLHCHFEGACVAHREVADLLSSEGREWATTFWTQMYEPAIDLVACAWAERLPLMQDVVRVEQGAT